MKTFGLALLILCLAPFSVVAKNTPESFADMAEKLSPAVVNIATSKTIKSGSSRGNQMFDGLPKGHPFEDFNKLFERFGGKNGQRGTPKDRKTQSLGSGFVIDADGYVVTNNHVIEGAEEIKVIFKDDTEYDAEVIGSDKKTDLALLKIKTKKPLPFVKFGDSDASRVGDWILVIGNPFGLGGSVSAGIISARGRDINAGPFDDFIQTDAAINRGNSGGPMFNLDGEVIGINTAIFSPGGTGSIGIGFAVPTSMAAPIINQLKSTGTIKRGWLGVRIQHVTEDIADSLGMEKAYGALVAEVMKDSPAKEAGVEVGDIITHFDGKEVTEMKKLPRFVAETPVDKEVEVRVLRDGDEEKLNVTVARLDEGEEKAKPVVKSTKPDDKEAEELLGMELLELDDGLRSFYNLEDDVEGLVVRKLLSGGLGSERGMRVGDVIVEVNRHKADSVTILRKQIDRATDKSRKSVLLLVARAGDTVFIAVPVSDE